MSVPSRHYPLVRVAISFALIVAAAGCAASPRSEAKTRAALQAFADTSSTRVNIVADQLARTTDDLGDRATLNREKITVANMGIDNAVNAHAMTGLLDMVFQFDLKARSAERRLERVRAAASQAADPSAMEKFAEQLAAVHAQNRDEAWKLVAERLSADQLRGLRAMIDEWYAKNGDLDRASVQIAELGQYAGSDPSRALVLSLVDLRDTNEQVDRVVWGAQRLYQNSHWQFRRMLFDAVEEFAKPRDESIQKVAQAVSKEREKMSEDAKGVVHTVGHWIVTATAILGGALIACTLLVWSRLPHGKSARAHLLTRIESLERAIAGHPDHSVRSRDRN